MASIHPQPQPAPVGLPVDAERPGADAVARPVAVAISAHGVSPAAVRYAVAEAARRGTGVRLVHAHPGHADPVEAERLWTIAVYRLEMAADLARHVGEDRVPVTTALLEGDVADAVLAVAASSALLVVERPSHVRLHPESDASVSRRLVLESTTPIVVVPDWWGDVPPRLPGSVVHLTEESLADCLDRTQNAGLLVVDLTDGPTHVTPAVRAALRHASCPTLVLVASPEVEASTPETAARRTGGPARRHGILRLVPDC